ncbi:DNA polymerase I [Isosphaeraceae bacterium EP7]
MTARPVFYVLDAYSLIFQNFHAIPKEMAGPGGQPTNATFGMFRDVLSLLSKRKPDYLAAAFDGGGKLLRSDIFPEYKGQRAEMPVELVSQIPVIRRVFEGFDVPVLIQPGYEADDVIATLARQGEARGMDVYICTADKDARQLLSDHVKIVNLRKDEIMDPAALLADWGIRPDQVVDLLSLTGDTVDNVPGIPGIGLKTATTLLQQFGTLDNLLANIDKVAGAKRKENLREHAETARRGRVLIELKDDLELGIDWDDLKVSQANIPALRTLCMECGFHTFLRDLGDAPRPEQAAWVAEYVSVDTPEAFDAFLVELRKQPRISVDTETTSIDPLQAELVGLSFCWEQGKAYYLPVKGPEGARVLDLATTLDAIRPILTDPMVEKIGQNIKYDMLVLGRAGLHITAPISDTMVLSYLLESGERNHNLDQLSMRLLDHSMIPITALIGKGKTQTTIDKVDVAKVAEYAGEDADATWRIEAILAPKVREEGLWMLYDEVERPLIAVLTAMEDVGVKVDIARLAELSVEFAGRIAEIEEKIYALAGHPFNIGSTLQLRQVLFDELKLPSPKKTPGGEASTAADVLEELAPLHPLPRLLIDHRQLSKLKSTYLDALPTLVHPVDARVHASFNQVVTATGRLSSSDPNLQNIPVRTEDGRQIRQAFVAGHPGWSILTADYSQIELRVLAHFSKDPALVHAFASDHDIHAAVAGRIFGVPEAEVTSAQRRMAKTVNFGVIYGIQAFGLAARLGISQKDAGAFIDAYFREYEGVAAFIRRTLESAQATGRVETILGRRRPIQGIKNTSERMKTQAERFAVNTVIQGSAADLIKKAMLLVDSELRRQGLKARLMLQIHDELLFEAPDEEIPALTELVRRSMTTALTLDVPLKVDVSVGPNWLDVRPA